MRCTSQLAEALRAPPLTPDTKPAAISGHHAAARPTNPVDARATRRNAIVLAGNPHVKLNLSISNLITKAARVVTHRYQRECAPHGISPSQAGILYTLNLIGGATQVEIAKRLHLEKTNVNAMVKKLEAAKLVEIRWSTDDARKSEIVLTSEGKKLARALNEIDRVVGEEYLKLAGKDAQAIRRFLERIVFGE